LSGQHTKPDANSGASAEAAPTVSASEKIFIRLAFWQTILSVVGVFIAVVALYAALTESEAIRRQTSAAVWPFIQVSIADYDTAEDAGFTLTFGNTGVGPALIRSVRVEVDGAPMRDWAQVIAYLGGTLDEHVGRKAINQRVLSPGQKIALVSVTEPTLARKFQTVVRDGKTAITFCYCSIFNECWLADSRSPVLDPRPVDACPDYHNESFDY
jgi:hypothetical protein